jgi:hypothetical protein
VRPRPGLGILLVALTACGYQLGAGTARLPPGAERVFVRPLENRTTNAEVGAIVATSLRQELARRRADGDARASARIEGAVEEATFGASSPNGATYRLALVVSARLMVGDRVVAEQRARREEDWLAGLDALESEGRRRLAMRRAAEGLARELIDRFEVP